MERLATGQGHRWRTFVGRFVLVATVLTLASTEAAEAPDPAALKALVEAKSLRCTFGGGTVGDWRGGELKKQKDRSLGGPLQFDAINHKTRTARLIGNQGAGDISVFLTSAGVHFIEQTAFGSVMYTSIFPFRVGDAFAAVTSRHISLLGAPLPSQYHGTCKVWE